MNNNSVFRTVVVFSALIIACSFSTPSFAKFHSRLESLLKSKYRPTIAQIVRVAEACKECKRELQKGNALQHLQSQTLIDETPRIVAQLETFYPNGVYATLGRDSFFVADLLEAFYLAIGIDNRVVRLGASTQTFTGFGRGMSILKFLKSNGFD